MKVRVSPIYSFLRKAEAPFKLFLRYYACEPQDGPEYEFYNDIEDAPIQIPKYVPPEPGYDKKNVAPKEDHPSFSGESWNLHFPVLTKEQGPIDERSHYDRGSRGNNQVLNNGLTVMINVISDRF